MLRHALIGSVAYIEGGHLSHGSSWNVRFDTKITLPYLKYDNSNNNFGLKFRQVMKKYKKLPKTSRNYNFTPMAWVKSAHSENNLRHCGEPQYFLFPRPTIQVYKTIFFWKIMKQVGSLFNNRSYTILAGPQTVPAYAFARTYVASSSTLGAVLRM